MLISPVLIFMIVSGKIVYLLSILKIPCEIFGKKPRQTVWLSSVLDYTVCILAKLLVTLDQIGWTF